LNAEIQKIHGIIGSSFLGQREFNLNLHPSDDDSASIKVHGDAILAAENSRAAADDAAFVADKKRILQAGVAAMHRAGRHSFVSSKQRGFTLFGGQAALPTEVRVNYDVPSIA